MLELKKLELYHFVSKREITLNIKEALKLQVSTFLQTKYLIDEDIAKRKAFFEVEGFTIELNKLLKNKNIDEIENKLNKSIEKQNNIFTEMINTLKNKEISKKFDDLLIKKLKTSRQSKGIAFLLIENSLNNENEKKDIKRTVKLLENFNENDAFLSKAKILNSIRKMTSLTNKDKLNNAFETAQNKTENKKESVFIKPIFDFLSELLDYFTSDLEKLIIEKIKEAAEVLKLAFDFVIGVLNFTNKKVTEGVEKIDSLRFEKERANEKKRKNLKKLKYKRF